MRYLIMVCVILSTILLTEKIEAKEMVTVKLVNHIGETSTLEIELKGNYRTLSPTLTVEEGVNYTLKTDGEMFLLESEKGTKQLNDSFVLIPQSYDKNHVIKVNDRPYLGAMEFIIEDEKYIRPINQLPMEDYLKGVVPFEVYPSWGIETLKAQALAARTYAVSHLHDKNMDDTISYQVYGGYTWEDKTTKAVKQTSGEVITYHNRLINAFYSASNGGVTESNAHVWGGKPLPYFPIKEDPYDPVHPWEFTLNKDQIELSAVNWEDIDWWNQVEEKDTDITKSMKRWLNKNGYPGDIKILSIPRFEISNKQLESNRSVKGSITIEFLQRFFEGTVLFRQLKLEDVNLNRIRPMIGGTRFKSYFIDSLDVDEGIYTMKGNGYGHGVGMSQWGAQVMGEHGKTYEEIIEFYYPGTTIKQVTKK